MFFYFYQFSHAVDACIAVINNRLPTDACVHIAYETCVVGLEGPYNVTPDTML